MSSFACVMALRFQNPISFIIAESSRVSKQIGCIVWQAIFIRYADKIDFKPSLPNQDLECQSAFVILGDLILAKAKAEFLAKIYWVIFVSVSSGPPKFISQKSA